MAMKYLFLIMTIGLWSSGFSQQPGGVTRISDDVEVVQVSENVYMHVSYKIMEKWGRISANGFVYIEKMEAFVFDTPWNNEQTEKLISWIEDSLKKKVVGFIPNHWHEDCIGGLEYIRNQKIKSYANQLTMEIAKSKGLPMPDIGFKDSLQLKLGNTKIECFYLGAAHSLDNIIVWIPSEQLLWAGCTLKGTEYKNIGFTGDGDIDEYPKTLNKVLAKFSNAKIVIPGHGDYGGIELIYHNLKLLDQ